MFVVPHLLGGLAFGKKQQVGRHRGVGLKHRIGQPDNRVQGTVFQQLLPHALLHAVAGEGAVGQHDARPAPVFEQVNHQNQEQVGAFAGAVVERKIVLVTVGHDAAKGRIGQDGVHALRGAIAAQRQVQRVAEGDVGHLHVVQDEVGGRQQVGQRLVLPADDVLGDAFEVFDVIGVPPQMLDGGREVAARAAARVQDFLAQLRVDHGADKLRDGAGRVEFPAFAGALQLFEDGFVEFAEGVAVFGHVEVDLVELVEDFPQVGAALHVVVVALKHLPHQQGALVGDAAARSHRQFAQGGEQCVIHEFHQFVACHAFVVGGPGRPVQFRRNGADVVVVQDFEFLVFVGEYF